MEHHGLDVLRIEGPGGLLTNLDLAASCSRRTNTVRIEPAHWAGLIHPQVAARQLASLDALAGGRLGWTF